MVKPELVEPQEKSRVTKNPWFPAVQIHARRSIPETATPHNTSVARMWKTLSAVSDLQ
jgi:hypothetical protein